MATLSSPSGQPPVGGDSVSRPSSMLQPSTCGAPFTETAIVAASRPLPSSVTPKVSGVSKSVIEAPSSGARAVMTGPCVSTRKLPSRSTRLPARSAIENR